MKIYKDIYAALKDKKDINNWILLRFKHSKLRKALENYIVKDPNCHIVFKGSLEILNGQIFIDDIQSGYQYIGQGKIENLLFIYISFRLESRIEGEFKRVIVSVPAELESNYSEKSFKQWVTDCKTYQQSKEYKKLISLWNEGLVARSEMDLIIWRMFRRYPVYRHVAKDVEKP